MINPRDVLGAKVWSSMSHRKKVTYKRIAKTTNAVAFKVTFDAGKFSDVKSI